MAARVETANDLREAELRQQLISANYNEPPATSES